MIYHRIFDNARAVLLGDGEEGVYGIAVEIYTGSSDDGVEFSIDLERRFHAAAAGVPHNVGVCINVSRARLHRKRRAELVTVTNIVVIIVPSVHKRDAGKVVRVLRVLAAVSIKRMEITEDVSAAVRLNTNVNARYTHIRERVVVSLKKDADRGL